MLLWCDLRYVPPVGDTGSIIVYNPHMEADNNFPGHPYAIVNPAWARLQALATGYTHWAELRKPL